MMADGAAATAGLREGELLLAVFSTRMHESASVVRQAKKIGASGVMANNRERLKTRARSRFDRAELEQLKRMSSFQMRTRAWRRRWGGFRGTG